LILHVPLSLLPIFDLLLPSHLVPVVIPIEPQSTTGYAIDPSLATHLANITKHLVFDPALDTLVNGIDLDVVRRNVRWLTGEAPSGIESRHSFTNDAIKAAVYIKGTSTCLYTPIMS
jgi:hypothetical protein